MARMDLAVQLQAPANCQARENIFLRLTASDHKNDLLCGYFGTFLLADLND